MIYSTPHFFQLVCYSSYIGLKYYMGLLLIMGEINNQIIISFGPTVSEVSNAIWKNCLFHIQEVIRR